jgi:hypothetical protein
MRHSSTAGSSPLRAEIELGGFDAAAGRLHVTTSAISQRIEARESMRYWVSRQLWRANCAQFGESREALQPEGHKDQRDGTHTGDEAGHDARYRVRHGSNFCL